MIVCKIKKKKKADKIAFSAGPQTVNEGCGQEKRHFCPFNGS